MANVKMRLGATPLGGGRTQFRVWAPDRKRVDVWLETPQGPRCHPLDREEQGYFAGICPAGPGMRYRYRLDGGDSFPDPCSRSQPEGPHGPSEIVDPIQFRWSDAGWRGLKLKGQVLYELHVGTFTPEGTYAGLMRQLPALVELGVTVLELMPLNTFPGRFNWGYDGVGLFAPCAVYGSPDELRRLLDEAHRLGLGIILDVVYNHLGPDGNYLRQFARSYFTDEHPTEWGEPPRFEGVEARPIRDFFIQNAAYWISEFHFDGLRLDATQCLFDRSERHIAAEIAEAARAAAEGRELLLVAENEPQDVRYIEPPSKGGHGLDAIWVDDFHHSVRVASEGSAEAYLRDYRGNAQELLSCALRNSLYQGQRYAWQDKPRGSVLRGLPAERVVFFLQNHDQISNSLRGERLQQYAGAPVARALTTFFLLLPQTPMLFMGQEFFASAPFLYFSDHVPELQEKVNEGRTKYIAQFDSAREAIEREGYRLPTADEAFRRSRLDLSEREKHAGALALHRELLRLRRADPVFAAQDARRLEGAVLSASALVLRYSGHEEGDRLLLLNLGSDLRFDPCPEPLLAPIPGKRWRLLLSSEEIRFGGAGALCPDGTGAWMIPGRCALVLAPEELETRK